MKCTYTFQVMGNLKVSFDQGVKYKNLEYLFVSDENNIVTHLKVTTSVPKNAPLPSLRKSTSHGIAAELNVPSFILPIIKENLRSLEGFLSLCGLDSINMDEPEVEWIPESKDEEASLDIRKFRIERGEIPPEDIREVPLDMLLKSIIAADQVNDYEIALSFFRKGKNDYYDGRYIESIYDFYFMIEHLYGAGKSRNQAVLDAFLENKDMLKHVKKVLNNPPLDILADSHLASGFNKKYAGRSEKEVLEEIVRLRGYLHHHNSRRPGMWHPDNHGAYKLDAAIIRYIAYEVAVDILLLKLGEKSVIEEFDKLIQDNKL